MKNSSNIVFLLFSAVVVAAGAYWYISGSTADQPPLTADATQNEKQAQFQALIAQLPTTFDTSIFSDERFMALRDLTTPVAQEAQGRIDPFAPISGVRAQ